MKILTLALILIAGTAYGAEGTISANVYQTVRTNTDGSIVVTDGQREFTCYPRGNEYYCGGK